MFEKYHFLENAKIITSNIPGPKSLELLNKQEELESNNRSYPRGIPIAFDKAKGASVTDVDGNLYIDFFSGCGVLNFGHNNVDILEDLKKYPDAILQTMDFPTKVKIDFMEKLLASLPEKMRGKYKINFGGPTGSDAVEAALKLARINTKRNGIVSFQGAYHGMTMGALSVTSASSKKDGLKVDESITFMPYCSQYRCPMKCDNNGSCNFECINSFQNFLENSCSGVEKPAAIIIEPIQGEGGTYIPKEGWLEKIVEIAKRNDVLVIFDEIQAGFYRTGKLFSFEHTNAIPDIVTMSKGIGGIGLPLSLIILRKELDTWKPGTHIGTFRGNQMAMMAGLSAMELADKSNIKLHVEKIGGMMFEKLEQIKKKFDFIGDVRAKGMMFGIEYVKSKDSREPDSELAKKIRTLCYQNGLLVEIGGYHDNVVRFLPPLVITSKMADNGLKIFEKANEIAEDEKRSGK